MRGAEGGRDGKEGEGFEAPLCLSVFVFGNLLKTLLKTLMYCFSTHKDGGRGAAAAGARAPPPAQQKLGDACCGECCSATCSFCVAVAMCAPAPPAMPAPPATPPTYVFRLEFRVKGLGGDTRLALCLSPCTLCPVRPSPSPPATTYLMNIIRETHGIEKDTDISGLPRMQTFRVYLAPCTPRSHSLVYTPRSHSLMYTPHPHTPTPPHPAATQAANAVDEICKRLPVWSPETSVNAQDGTVRPIPASIQRTSVRPLFLCLCALFVSYSARLAKIKRQGLGLGFRPTPGMQAGSDRGPT